MCYAVASQPKCYAQGTPYSRHMHSKMTVRPEIKAVNSIVVMCGMVHGQRGASEVATERSDGDGERAPLRHWM